MASARAQEVAEILWELKRAGKVSRYTTVARRAGFAPGAGGRTINNTITAVRKDWPHLQWWRVIPDDGTFDKDSDLHKALLTNGFVCDEGEKKVALVEWETLQMEWPEPEKAEEAAAVPAAPAKK